MTLRDLMDLADPFDVCDCHETEGLGFAGKLCEGCAAKPCCVYCHANHHTFTNKGGES